MKIKLTATAIWNVDPEDEDMARDLLAKRLWESGGSDHAEIICGFLGDCLREPGPFTDIAATAEEV